MAYILAAFVVFVLLALGLAVALPTWVWGVVMLTLVLVSVLTASEAGRLLASPWAAEA